jgi:hypothetical protein
MYSNRHESECLSLGSLRCQSGVCCLNWKYRLFPDTTTKLHCFNFYKRITFSFFCYLHPERRTPEFGAWLTSLSALQGLRFWKERKNPFSSYLNSRPTVQGQALRLMPFTVLFRRSSTSFRTWNSNHSSGRKWQRQRCFPVWKLHCLLLPLQRLNCKRKSDALSVNLTFMDQPVYIRTAYVTNAIYLQSI